MSSDLLFNLTLSLYLLTAFFNLIYLTFRKEKIEIIGYAFLVIAFILHTITVAFRWYITRQPPFVTIYESILFYSWSIAFAYLFFALIYKIKFLSPIVSVTLVFAFGGVSILDKTAQPLMPALKSNWLVIHVVSYFIGYGAATISFILALSYLITVRRKPDERVLNLLDRLSWRFITLAFPFLTIGLTTGSVWANVAWGSWWQWDPKETWSLITWLVYAVYLHLRLFKGIKGRTCAYLNILGFFCILFTFLGVNYLLSGLHSYM
jgi:cytochrome c-type biogenesis protein CcsB